VFTCWIKSLELVADALQASNINYARIHGRCSAVQRAVAMKQFHDDATTRVLLMTTGTGAMG
jgi:SNF2 family DNA or RNA helicase